MKLKRVNSGEGVNTGEDANPRAGVISGKEVFGGGVGAHRLNAIGDVLNQASSLETGVESEDCSPAEKATRTPTRCSSVA